MTAPRAAARRRRKAPRSDDLVFMLPEGTLLILLAYLDMCGQHGTRAAAEVIGEEPEAGRRALADRLARELVLLSEAIGALAVPYRLRHGLSLNEAMAAAAAWRQRAAGATGAADAGPAGVN